MDQQDLVLVGGGHTHVLLIRALAMRPIAGVRVTLVSEKTLTPYSGMLPGFVAGHYAMEQTNIDLNQLCRRAGVRWIKARVTMIDPVKKRVSLADQANLEFDKLSIDIGSTPDLSISGAREHAVGVKPIANFQQRWKRLLAATSAGRESTSDPRCRHWGVVGAGAGGVELVLAMAYRMRHNSGLRFHLVFRGDRVLPGYPSRVITTVERYLQDAGVLLHPNFNVCAVTADGLRCDTGEYLELQQSILCTGAVGAPWLSESALECTTRNFITVNPYLQSTSHSCVFAVGDIAESIDDPRPKAGVFAVRQAPFLEQNLRLMFAGKPMCRVKLQKHFLSLLSMGDRKAVASRNGLVVSGSWVWRWKNSIDLKFMRQFSEMEMGMSSGAGTEVATSQIMHCGGCGSKLGPAMLMENLNQLTNQNSLDDLNPERFMAEDASFWMPEPNTVALQSIDGFRNFSSDEYRFGRICVNHAASDIHAMGAGLTHAQAWINLAFSGPRLHQRDHLRTLQGIVDALTELGARLSGGHSTEGAESHLAIVANGEMQPGSQWTKAGMQAGDVLVLSKRLGVGVILAADMQGQATAEAVDAAYDSMLRSNHTGMRQLQVHRPNAVTDITGFGLLGHLLEMLDGAAAKSGQSLMAELELSQILTIPGALQMAEAGWRSSLYPQLKPYLQRCCFDGDLDLKPDSQYLPAKLELLLDPQTSGGLLAALTTTDADALLKNNSDFVAIGSILTKSDQYKGLADIRIK